MKITDVKIIPVNRYLFVQIYTDEGYVGTGESGVMLVPHNVLRPISTAG